VAVGTGVIFCGWWHHDLWRQEVMLEGKLASVQAEFEPIFWVHTDPAKILRFAEESVCGRLEFESELKEAQESISSPAISKQVGVMLRAEYAGKIQSRIDGKTLVYSRHEDIHSGNKSVITREEALSLVGIESFRVQDCTDDMSGPVAEIFTIDATREQVAGPEFIDVEPFIARRVTTSFDVREIQ
jgi:hypothetical protein